MGSGKSTCAHYLKEKGYNIINADLVAKEVMNADPSIKRMLVKAFGKNIIAEDEMIRFPLLGEKVFCKEENLLRLNRIVHPTVIKVLETMLQRVEGGSCILDAALIPYWHIESWFQHLFWIHASKEIRFQRLKNVLCIGSDEIKKRIEFQEHLFAAPKSTRWCIINNEVSQKQLEKVLDNTILGILNQKHEDAPFSSH